MTSHRAMASMLATVTAVTTCSSGSSSLNGRTSLKQRFADSTDPMMQPIKTSKIFRRSLVILFTALETGCFDLGAWSG